jgi:integrase
VSKNGNGEGSIYPHKRNGKKAGYRGAYVVYTAAGPKRRYVTGKTREETRKKLAKAMADRDGGLAFDAGTLTVGEYVERWLKDSVQGTVRQSTYDVYGYMVHPHIVPGLGRLKLKSLNPAHVRAFYRDRLDTGLSPATVHKMHVVLHKALDGAVSDGLIPRNAAKGVKVPQAGSRKEIRPLTSQQARDLFDAARGDRLEALYVLAIATGLRQGELLALKWEDVELEEAVLRVRRTLTRSGGKVEVGPPKTPNSRRSVGLTSRAVEALRAHLARQLAEMEEMGSLYRPGGLVFANEIGGIINPSNLRNRHLVRLLERAKLPKVRFHDLRHTCATLLLTKNVNPKTVSEMLGHSSISVTLDTYSHVLPTMRANAVRALEEALK